MKVYEDPADDDHLWSFGAWSQTTFLTKSVKKVN